MSEVNFINQTIFKHTNLEFKYHKELGKGAFGRVFLIVSPKNLKFAVKMIELRGPIDPPKTNILKQAQLLSKLKHKNIIRYRGHILVKDKSLFIFCQYCDQGSLDQNLGFMNPAGINTVLVGITEGLVYLHQNEIVHQDIKLENIMLHQGVPKIGDFGLASRIGDTQQISVTQFRGTPFYVAPQLLQGSKYSPAGDIWALGLVFLELSLGKRIYQLLTGHQILCRRPDFPQVILKQVQQRQLRVLIRQMLARDPLKRPTPRQVLDYLINPPLQSAQVPDFSWKIKVHCNFQDKRVIRYDGRLGAWSKFICCEDCGGKAILKRESPVDEEGESITSNSKFTKNQLYRAGYGAQWECENCRLKGFWLREYQ